MRRVKSTKAGWAKVGRKHYRHDSGVEVKYNPNKWLWEVMGGENNGEAFGVLWAALHRAAKTPAVWA